MSNEISFGGRVDFSTGAAKQAIRHLENIEINSETSKEIKQFINTLRAVKRDGTSDVFTIVEKNFRGRTEYENLLFGGDFYFLEYGNFNEKFNAGKGRDADVFARIIDFGKKYFGEDKLNEHVDLKELSLIRKKIASLKLQKENIENEIDIQKKSIFNLF